ncbi:Alpha/Beta hydrolase protein, partial [Myxozyma melibiosi]
MVAPELLHQRFVLPDATPRASETTINIAGILVYLYGVNELTAAQRSNVTVLFACHGRTRSHVDSANLAHQLIHNLAQKGHTKGFVVATMDNRNHGTRAIDSRSIEVWKNGNPTHAQDMLSMVDGIGMDVRTIIKYLESYTVGNFVPKDFIMSGVSLSGHVTWNLLAQEPKINVAIPIVGTTSLTNLLIDRLGGYKSVAEVPDCPEWPKSLEKLYLERDELLTSIKGKRILILHGEQDTIVPDKFSKEWIEKYGPNNDIAYYHQEDTGHFVSFYYMDLMTDFLYPEL